MLYNIITVLGGILIIVYVFTTREGFFGLVRGLASIFLIVTIIGITGFPESIGRLLPVLYLSFLFVGVFYYTFGIGKVINIFLAVIMWLAVYFNFITIEENLLDRVLLVLHGDLLHGDFLHGLLIYLTVTGIASIFTLDSN